MPSSSARRVILLETRRDYDRFLPSEAAINSVREIVAGLQLHPDHGITVRLTGRVALEHEELKSVERGSVLVAGIRFKRCSMAMSVSMNSQSSSPRRSRTFVSALSERRPEPLNDRAGLSVCR